jgi:hypothetical protein
LNPEVDDRRPKLTRFLTQELLFEYISGSLHPARHRLVEEHLETDRDSQRELLNLSKGLEYAHEISKMRVSDALSDALLNFEPAWKKTLRAWTLWSWRRGWRALPYAFGLATLALGLAVWRPWSRKMTSEVTLAEQAHVEPRSLEKAVAADPSTPAPGARVLASAPGASTPTPAQAAAPRLAAPAANQGASLKPVAMVATGLRRGTLKVANFAVTWPIIREKVLALGGRAAGAVDLGWLRTPGESYFHFAVPETNMAELERFLRTFGPVQLAPEKSRRLMPEGQLRIILVVKDGGGGNEGKAETP